MKKLTTIIYLIALATALVGCATNQDQPQVSLPTSKTYDAPKGKIWPLIVARIAENYPVKVIEKDSGLITTEFVAMQVGVNNRGAEKFIIKPRVSIFSTWGGLRMNMSVLVSEPENGKTLVTFHTHYEAFEDNLTHSWMICDSTGYLENDILESISAKLPVTTAAK
jgi:hypothetical protein